jgi:drug/metabolite transporter (DMT)-like permease
MAALLALTAAAAYGAGDFLGGVASRRAPATAVVLWSHLVGLAALLVAAPLVGGELTTTALAYGSAAGIVGGLGVALFYKAMSMGSISVVAPITGLFSAIIPVFAGVAQGERPQAATLAGIAVALLAITLVSREAPASGVRRDRHEARAVLFALAAGFGFGLFFVLIGTAGSDVGIWPLVGARFTSVAMFSGLSVAGMTRTAHIRVAGGAAIGAGLLDVAANVSYVMALSHGLLSVVAVLTSLYPAGTVLLARYVLGERMSTVQQVGLGSAALAAVLIAA